MVGENGTVPFDAAGGLALTVLGTPQPPRNGCLAAPDGPNLAFLDVVVLIVDLPSIHSRRKD